MNEPTPAPPTDNHEVRHEPDVVNFRPILICAAALVASAVIIHIGAWWMFRYLDRLEGKTKPDQFPLAARERQREPPREGPTPAPPGWSATRSLPPPPREPQLEGIKRMEGQEAYVRPGMAKSAAPEKLSRYEWVDRAEGIARIPLEEAMDLIATNGLLPARSSAPGQEPTEPKQAPPSRANSGRNPERRQP